MLTTNLLIKFMYGTGLTSKVKIYILKHNTSPQISIAIRLCEQNKHFIAFLAIIEKSFETHNLVSLFLTYCCHHFYFHKTCRQLFYKQTVFTGRPNMYKKLLNAHKNINPQCRID